MAQAWRAGSLAAALVLGVLVATCSPGLTEADVRMVSGTALPLTGGGDLDYFPGDYSREAVLGNSLPGTWRPFATNSPWNTPIPEDAQSHPKSARIISFVASRAGNLRFINSYLPPIWVVNSTNAQPVGGAARATAPAPMDLQWVHVHSKIIFDSWDRDDNGISDVPIPLARGLYPEPTRDGHICIVDPFRKVSYEMSKFAGWHTGPPRCTTFNIWDLSGDGVGSPSEGRRWWARGGRGSGFPVIAGILRPEELSAGEIRHALVFTFGQNRRGPDKLNIMMHPPACRSDGRYVGEQYPIEGMRFQLDPTLTERDFAQWGLTREGEIVALALQRYGMFLGDNGGDMALVVQLLGPSRRANRTAWDAQFPGFYETIERIPVSRLRVVYTGEPTLR
jgi:hypothetical protein